MNHRNAIHKYVGFDVHKQTVSIAVAPAEGGKVRDVGVVNSDMTSIAKALRKLGKADTLSVTYEAGPTGYGLYRWLTAKGYHAQVIAPSLIPRKAGDRIKTDRRDARMLARLARAEELTAITVPDAGDEAMRDLTRAREDAVEPSTGLTRHPTRVIHERRQRQLPDGTLNGANPRISE